MIENQELPEKTWNSFEVLKVVKIIVGNYQKAEKCLEVFLNHPTDQSSTDFDDSEIILPEDEQDDVATPNPSSVEKNNSTEVPRCVIDEVNQDQEDYYDLYDKENYDDLLNEPKMFDKSPDPQKNRENMVEDKNTDEMDQREKLGQRIIVPETFQQIPERQFQYLVLNELSHLDNASNQVQQGQGQLLALFNSRIGSLKKPGKIPDLPMKELEIFESMNIASDEDDDGKCTQYLVRKLSANGEREIKPAINKMLKMLLEDVLARDFNWDGKNNRKAFKNTNFITVIEVACRKIFPADKASHKSVKNAIQDWLKNAPGRYNYPQNSANKPPKNSGNSKS
ncbi:hypothetical protein QAD02_019204 [Eretmocerus hayati]|uniref:Uncharacterized protein n=1 Tax=Eretmocerus hayati TaxID=131215 RepID=A0ACC2PM13_9HYME|nr:hypothetical protein QAD02_019204 [Eretmocerus hayati]